MFPFKENVVAGGLMSYGADPNYLYRRSAVYIDKFLKDTKPADLPVEQASKYELAINLKTAISEQRYATILQAMRAVAAARSATGLSDGYLERASVFGSVGRTIRKR
jgi:ABC-type uncharacterized transport system substrate-binding protein